MVRLFFFKTFYLYLYLRKYSCFKGIILNEIKYNEESHIKINKDSSFVRNRRFDVVNDESQII